MHAEEILNEWEKKFVHTTGFVDPLTDAQKKRFLTHPEIVDMSKFSDNQIKLAIFSAYLNRTSKLYDILKILNELNPKIPTKLDGSQVSKIYDSSKSKNSRMNRKSKKDKYISKSKKLSSEKKFEIRTKNRKIAKKQAELQELKSKIQRDEQLVRMSKKNLAEIELEKEENLKKFGINLSDSEIKNLMKIDIPGYEEARDHRFRRGPGDKDYT